MNAKDPKPSQELHSREALAPVFADLNQYAATMHFVGQSTIFTLTPDRATGEAYCLAHHVTVDGGKRRLMVASLRYLDTFVEIDGGWFFSERRLYVDWMEEPLEYSTSQSPLRWELTNEAFPIGADGKVEVPERPGLGVSLNQATVAKYRVG